MNTITTTAAILLLTSSAAQADGFRPWDDRGAGHETATYSVTELPVSGFSPWADRAVGKLPAGSSELPVSYFSTAFRPWAPNVADGSPS